MAANTGPGILAAKKVAIRLRRSWANLPAWTREVGCLLDIVIQRKVFNMGVQKVTKPSNIKIVVGKASNELVLKKRGPTNESTD